MFVFELQAKEKGIATFAFYRDEQESERGREIEKRGKWTILRRDTSFHIIMSA